MHGKTLKMHDININKMAELLFRFQETVHSKGKLMLRTPQRR